MPDHHTPNTRLYAALALGALQFGCGYCPVTTETNEPRVRRIAESIRLGMTPDELRETLRQGAPQNYPRCHDAQVIGEELYSPPRHLFSVPHNGEWTVALDVMLPPSVRYTFVFEDGGLAKIVPPPPSVWERSEKNGVPWWIGHPLDPDTERRWILNEPGLPLESVRESAVRDVWATVYSRRHLEPSPILMLFPLDHREPQYRRHVELAERYDGTKVQHGWPVQRVDDLFGTPRGTLDSPSGSVTRIYGEPELHAPYIYVVFTDGAVVSLTTGYVSE